MDHKWLDDFLAPARERNFSKAAARRHVTQPQFSRRIRALELWAGSELVNRSSVPIALTPAGDTLLAASKQAVHALAEARERIAHLQGGGSWTTLFTGCTLPGRAAKPVQALGFAPQLALAQILRDSLARSKKVLHLNVITESDFAESLHEQALQGAGMAWLPLGLVADDLNAGRLVRADADADVIRFEVRLFKNRHIKTLRLEKIWAAALELAQP